MPQQVPPASGRALSDDAGPGWTIVVVVLGLVVLGVAAVFYNHWQKYGNPFTYEVRPKKVGEHRGRSSSWTQPIHKQW